MQKSATVCVSKMVWKESDDVGVTVETHPKDDSSEILVKCNNEINTGEDV
jgi:hypothetical protein